MSIKVPFFAVVLFFGAGTFLAAGETTVEPCSVADHRAQRIAGKSPIIQRIKRDLPSFSFENLDLDKTVSSYLLDLELGIPSVALERADRKQVVDVLTKQNLVTDPPAVLRLFEKIRSAECFGRLSAAPGGIADNDGGHHAYPGGLLVHTIANIMHANSMVRDYNLLYGTSLSLGWVRAAAFWHDLQKTNTLRWKENGEVDPEPKIADTGAHHVLGIAEAIARKLPPQLVVVIASAHDAPNLQGTKRVVRYLEAASIIAGTDPVTIGLLRRTGDSYELRGNPPLECFINYLADHDFVLTSTVQRATQEYFFQRAYERGILVEKPFWLWNQFAASTDVVRLYEELDDISGAATQDLEDFLDREPGKAPDQ